MIYILYRKLSKLKDNDLILGVFTSKNKALKERNIYISTTKYSDPYDPQPNFNIDLEKDVIILERTFTKNHENPKTAYFILLIKKDIIEKDREIITIHDDHQDFFEGFKDIYRKLKKKKLPVKFIEFENVNLNKLRLHNKTKYPRDYFLDHSDIIEIFYEYF